MQAAINAAASYLPKDLPNPPIYSKVNPADTPILTLALTSDTLPLAKVEDFADTNLAQKISQLSGRWPGDASAEGRSLRCACRRIPTALASYGLSLEDLRTALGTANVDQAKGNLNGPRQSFTIQDNDQLLSSASLPAADHRLQERRAGPAFRRCERGGRRGEYNAGRVDEHQASGDPEYSAAARHEHHRRRRPRQESSAALAGVAARVDSSDDRLPT